MLNFDSNHIFNPVSWQVGQKRYTMNEPQISCHRLYNQNLIGINGFYCNFQPIFHNPLIKWENP